MEKISRKLLNELPSLKKLEDNWEQWGLECKEGTRSWRSSGLLYLEIRNQIKIQTAEHCSFCDDHPIGTNSTETVEHYFPKKEYPCLTYYWENLFYCCTKCQSEANKYSFEYTLKPDNKGYDFHSYFYFDLNTGQINILANLKKETPNDYLNAATFLKRYGINSNKRKQNRINIYKDILNFFKAGEDPTDLRTREDFAFRCVYDEALKFYNQQNKLV